MAYAAKDISILKGLQPVRERPGMYIGSTGPTRPAPPRLRGRRQLGRRGARGPRDPHRRDVAGRRRLPRRRQRPRHPGRPAPRVPRQVRGRDRAHDAARRRQVRRRGLQDLRWPARRRRVGRERAVAPARARDRPRRRALRADVRRRWRARPVRSTRTGDSDHTGTSVTFWPDRTIMEELEFRAQTLRRAPAGDGVPQQGPRDRLPRRAARRTGRAGLQVRRRHRRLRACTSTRPRSRCSTVVVSIGDTYDAGEVEIAMQWNTGYYEGLHSFANNIATTEGGMHEEGFKKSLTNVMNRYARQKGHLKEKDENLTRRGHPRGPHRDHLGEAAQPAVRGPDEDEARQHRDPLVRREGHERQARRVARGAPDRGPSTIVAEGAAGGTRAHGGRARRATSRAASRCSSRRRCRASSPTARRATPKRPSCSSSRATAPAAARRRPATRRSRRSCRSAARS